MKSIFEIKNDQLIERKKIIKNSWVHLNNPTEEEINDISNKLKIEESSIKKALDRSELPHIEIEEFGIMYIINIPYVIHANDKKKYRALPFGIFFHNTGILTVSLNNHPLIKDIKHGNISNLSFYNKNNFPIGIFG